MAQPVEVFKSIKGMTRDFAVDSLPDGYLWDMVDAIPNRKGARVEQRGNWDYLGTNVFGGTIQGGYHAAFTKGIKLLVVANSQLWDVNMTTGAATAVGACHARLAQNGVKLNDRVYFFDGAGLAVPKVVTFDGTTLAIADLPATAPKAKVGIVYKGRLVCAGVPATPSNVYFSRLEDDNLGVVGGPVGPLAAWDAEAFIGTNNEVTGLSPMAGQILAFHASAIERIRGGVPPGTDIDDDMATDTLTEQVGTIHPHTIVPWRENILFADDRGVFLTDGSTVRNLTELGGMGDFWRVTYGAKRTGGTVSPVAAGVFLDYLCVTVNATIQSGEYSFTLVCDLNTRSWFRFSNFPATCYIPSESAMEQSWVGHLVTNRIATVSGMFQDPVPPPVPPPDYIDGNGEPVLAAVTTGFNRLAQNEGMQRIHNLFLSYHHESFVRAATPDGISVEYRTDPPTPEDIDATTGEVTGWTLAGKLPDTQEYARKKLPVGKRGYGIMVRFADLTQSRITRIYSIGVEQTSQDRAKVTT